MFSSEAASRFNLIFLHMLRRRKLFLSGMAVLSIGLAALGCVLLLIQPESVSGAVLRWVALAIPFIACVCLCVSETPAFWDVHFVARGIPGSIVFSAFATLFAVPGVILIGSLIVWSVGVLAGRGAAALWFAVAFPALIMVDYLLCFAIACFSFSYRFTRVETIVLCGLPAILTFMGTHIFDGLAVNYFLMIAYSPSPESFATEFSFVGGFVRLGEVLALSVGLVITAARLYAASFNR